MTMLVATTTAVLGLGGCGSSTEEPSSDPSAAASEIPSPEADSPAAPSPSPTEESSEGDLSDEQLDQLGGVVADTPQDLTWGVGEVPGSWSKTVEEQGEIQWQVSEQCLLTLQQPAGLGNDGPTQDEVIADGITFLEQGTGAELTQGKVTERRFPVLSNLEDATMSSAVSIAGFTGPNGVEGEIYAHRGGDFALIAITLCGDDTFAEVDAAELRPFLTDELAIKAKY